MNEHYYSLIMAGGVGKRFWPRSRKNSPKQLLDIVGQETMINKTINRLKSISPPERILIITNFEQAEMIMAQNTDLKRENFIIEPSGKNTAPAIGLAASILLKRDRDAVMGVFPADHLIENTPSFHKYLNKAIEFAAASPSLLTFGITPTRPATGYGYIQINRDLVQPAESIFEVKTFAEKPNVDTARRFVKSGEFLWNSGMFVWQASVILKALKKYMRDLYDPLLRISDAIGKPNYEKELQAHWFGLQPESIDYGVLERARNVCVVEGDFDWSDVGSWDAVYDIEEKDKHGNVFRSEGAMLKSSNNYIYSRNATIFARNINDLILIEDQGIILIIPRGDSEQVKEIVDYLPVLGKEDLL